jgi:hypothetical protein
MDKKLIKLSSLSADLKKEREGDWVDSNRNPGVAYRVRSLASPAYLKARTKLLRTMSMNEGDAAYDPDAVYDSSTKLILDHILLDWRGFDVPYSAEAAKELLDPGYRMVVSDIEDCAARVGKKSVEYAEVETKN